MNGLGYCTLHYRTTFNAQPLLGLLVNSDCEKEWMWSKLYMLRYDFKTIMLLKGVSYIDMYIYVLNLLIKSFCSEQ